MLPTSPGVGPVWSRSSGPPLSLTAPTRTSAAGYPTCSAERVSPTSASRPKRTSTRLGTPDAPSASTSSPACAPRSSSAGSPAEKNWTTSTMQFADTSLTQPLWSCRTCYSSRGVASRRADTSRRLGRVLASGRALQELDAIPERVSRVETPVPRKLGVRLYLHPCLVEPRGQYRQVPARGWRGAPGTPARSPPRPRRGSPPRLHGTSSRPARRAPAVSGSPSCRRSRPRTAARRSSPPSGIASCTCCTHSNETVS